MHKAMAREPHLRAALEYWLKDYPLEPNHPTPETLPCLPPREIRRMCVIDYQEVPLAVSIRGGVLALVSDRVFSGTILDAGTNDEAILDAFAAFNAAIQAASDGWRLGSE